MLQNHTSGVKFPGVSKTLSFSMTNEILALLIAIFTVISYIGSIVWLRLAPHFFYPEEEQLEKKITELRDEAQKYLHADDLHIHGKLTRQALLLSKQLAEMRRSRLCSWSECDANVVGTAPKAAPPSTGRFCVVKWLWLNRYNTPVYIFFLIRFGFMIPVLFFYRNTSPLVTVPFCFRCHVPIARMCELILFFVVHGPLWFVGEGSSTASMLGNSMISNNNMNAMNPSQPSGVGVFTWFVACFTAVYLAHRVWYSCQRHL